jgi:hypothetical protein
MTSKRIRCDLSESQISWIAYAAKDLRRERKSCYRSQCSMALTGILSSIGRWSNAGFLKRKAAK